MIYGIGTDILALSRIQQLYHRYGQALAKRILSPCEHAQWRASSQPERFLAKRFAAKEAFSKAVGTGIRTPVSFRNIIITHDQLGKPIFQYEAELQTWLNQRQINQVHLSISDEQDHILAFAIAETH